jgi:hypothetical protein
VSIHGARAVFEVPVLIARRTSLPLSQRTERYLSL